MPCWCSKHILSNPSRCSIRCSIRKRTPNQATCEPPRLPSEVRKLFQTMDSGGDGTINSEVRWARVRACALQCSDVLGVLENRTTERSRGDCFGVVRSASPNGINRRVAGDGSVPPWISADVRPRGSAAVGSGFGHSERSTVERHVEVQKVLQQVLLSKT